MLYGNWSAGGSAPSDGNFTLRARLVEFDIENVTNARGWVFYQLTPTAEGLDPTAKIS